MAAMALPSLTASVRIHVRPRSPVRSKWTRQPLSSLLEGHSRSPLASCTGLFLIDPKVPSGKRRGGDQVRPPSSLVMSIPHHVLGEGPAL